MDVIKPGGAEFFAGRERGGDGRGIERELELETRGESGEIEGSVIGFVIDDAAEAFVPEGDSIHAVHDAGDAEGRAIAVQVKRGKFAIFAAESKLARVGAEAAVGDLANDHAGDVDKLLADPFALRAHDAASGIDATVMLLEDLGKDGIDLFRDIGLREGGKIRFFLDRRA